ncbi:hypothetical protein OG272_15700 [Streptomyces sp. NBC_00104]|uniref:hypothetical protein n=1 Tax=Streptomyces sp. NBC_00104 TaxID=2903621 RepID=UPI00324E2AC3
MPVEPIPCAPDSGTGTPVEVTTCCAPSIASTALCRADGTTVLLVVRSGCVECGETAQDPEVVGWIDPATGTFTPGPAPADAGPCDTGCVDTICVQRCDDTDGDGAANATYNELWCVRLDGTTELVLTYEGDPSQPYTPVSPVDCEYGCVETQTYMLCDDTGTFLRRITIGAGQHIVEDLALDGLTPHTVSGTVGACAGDGSPCEEPTTPTATVGLCLADGTPIAVIITRDCTGIVTQDGWVDLTTGAYTPGTPPADTGPCDTTCVDTVCVQRCDDTDGDGAADVTYNELWCVRMDGTTELVLTYQGDPSEPYTPVSPVDCEYGCVETATYQLCDDTGMFLRRITIGAGQHIVEDLALDGLTPHTVVGTVGACAGDGSPCEEPTTPTATVGLCLADGTPIAVVITRDCTGLVTQDGWINLTTGTFSTGAPPAGAMACGDSRAFELAGILCDVDPATDEVLGLVLVEYEYNADGSLASVRLVDPATGTTYTLQGELRHCPTGTEQPDLDLTVLCDIAADGTVTEFVRDYRRDENGQITGHTDYTLDGQPYTPAGTVGVCAEPCRNTSTLLVCDLPTDGIEGAPTAADTSAVPYPWDADPVRCVSPLAGGGQALWDGGSRIFPQDTTAAGTCDPNGFQVLRGVAATLQVPRPSCDDGTVTVTISVRVTNNGPRPGAPNYNGSLRLHRADTGARLALSPMLTATPVSASQTLTVTATVPADLLAAGQLVTVLDLETFDSTGGNTGTAWTADQFTASYAYGITGCETQFLRNVITDCATGEVVAVTDTTLDGQPYTVTGEVGQCTAAGGGQCCPEEPCRNTSTLLLCDLPTDGTPAPTVTDTAPASYYPYPTGVATTGAQTLWDGGTLTLPDAAGPQPGTTGTVRTAAAIIQAPRPVCDAGTAHVSVQVDAAQLGPDDGCASTGFIGLYNGTSEADRIALDLAPRNTPAGWSGTLTVEADVPAVDLAAGNIAVALAFDAYDDSGGICPGVRRTSWQLSQFAATVVYDQTGCATQFLRNVVTDCETGEVTTVTDTTLDGQPYFVTGEPGQCEATGGQGSPEEPCLAQNVIEACRCDDTDGDGVGDVDYVELLAVDCNGALTSLGTYTADLAAPYTPVAPVDCGAGDIGAEPATGVQAHRVQLVTGGTWDASAHPTLRSVTATAHTGTGQITTADGTSTLFQGESVTWAIDKDEDASLTGPLTITASTGITTITFTTGVTL